MLLEAGLEEHCHRGQGHEWHPQLPEQPAELQPGFVLPQLPLSYNTQHKGQSLVCYRPAGSTSRQQGSPDRSDVSAHALHMLVVSGQQSTLILMMVKRGCRQVLLSMNALSCHAEIHEEVQISYKGSLLVVVDPAVQHPLLAGLVALLLLLLLLSCWWAAWCWEAWGLCTPRAGEGSRMGSAAFIITCPTASISKHHQTEDAANIASSFANGTDCQNLTEASRSRILPLFIFGFVFLSA